MALRVDARSVIAAFVAALLVLAALLWVVGVDDVLTALALADPRPVAVMVGVALAWLLCWGLALRTVLAVLGISISVPRAFATFAAATFANNVTPFGQAGGEPVSALLIANTADTEYETALASIASVDALNFVPSIGLALAGVTYYAARFTVGRRLRVAGAAIAALAVVVVVLALVGWRYRRRIERLVAHVVTPGAHALAYLLPGRAPPSRSAVHGRVRTFFGAIDRVATDRRRLAVALAFSTLGWLAIMASLWLSLYALGYVVAFAVVLVAVPVGSMAGATPLPGGLGGIETVLVALLVPIPGVSPAAATAAVVLHRTVTYWLPLLLGAAVWGSTSADGLW